MSTDDDPSPDGPESAGSAEFPADHPNGPLEVRHQPGQFRLLARGDEAAVLDYVVRPGAWDIVHTYSAPRFRGTGLASILVQHVFDQARMEGLHVIPSCPYIPVWVGRHPRSADLIGVPR